MKKINLILIAIFLLGAFLRLFQVQNNPPGLYIDEVSIGYNAFSILEKGVDEHGESYPLFFEAFGEYKMPVYIYSVAGVMALIGKSDFAVRIPSILAGIFSIPLFYLFLRKLLNLNLKLEIPIIATVLLAISPWHIHFSRAGFEANLALFLFLLGSYVLLIFWKNKEIRFLVLSFSVFAISVYTYNSYRVIAPLTVGISSFYIFIKFAKLRKQIVSAFIVFVILITPIIQFSLTDEGATRFSQTSTFSEYTARSPDEKQKIYPMLLVKNYISYFSFDYLFAGGDGNGRHQLPGFGLIFHFIFPFIIIGLFVLIKQKSSIFKSSVLYMLLVAPLPAIIVAPNPHTLRSLLMVLPLTILASIGVEFTFRNITKFKKVIITFVILAAIYEMVLYLHQYHYHYYKVNSPDWGAGYKEMVMKASDYKSEYDYIVIDKNLADAEIYVNFYDNELNPIYVDTDWNRPDEWKGKVLYIRPFYGRQTDPQIIDQATLPGRDDIHAQFWRL